MSLDYPYYEELCRRKHRAAWWWLVGDRLYYLGLLPGVLALPAAGVLFVAWLLGLGEHLAEQVLVLADALDLLHDELLDLPGRDRLRRTGVPAPFLRRGADVVAVAPGAAGRVAGRHGAIARNTAQKALEQGTELVADRGAARAAIPFQ